MCTGMHLREVRERKRRGGGREGRSNGADGETVSKSCPTPHPHRPSQKRKKQKNVEEYDREGKHSFEVFTNKVQFSCDYEYISMLILVLVELVKSLFCSFFPVEEEVLE